MSVRHVKSFAVTFALSVLFVLALILLDGAIS